MKMPFWRAARESNKSTRKPAAHMTFAQTSFGRSLVRTGFFLKRQLWIWPIIAILALSIIGFFVNRAIETTMKANLKSELETLLTVETEMLKNWYSVQKAHAMAVANSPSVRKAVTELISEQLTGKTKSLDELQQAQLAIAREVAHFLDANDHEGFIITDRRNKIVATSTDDSSGMHDAQSYAGFLSRVYQGEAVVSTPVASAIPIKDENGAMRTGMPTMYAAAPIQDENLQVVGALALRIQPEKEFTRILQLGRIGQSGETYAFDRLGMMVSNSRFDHDLILLGLLPDQPNSKSILNLLLREPGGDMTRGYRPVKRRSELPLTRMASSAIEGQGGVDVEGYKDYRGVPVVGAWTWLPEYEIGIATEIDLAEAYRPLTILSRVFWSLYALLVSASIAIFVFTLIVNRMQREAQRAAIEAQELGQYKLEQKLGAGAMGVVYKGYHAMMRRPTAIKLLNIESMNDQAIARFEHEVQITSQLNHPNTIAIYDYGRTPEGVFYYAMEYLDGIDLQALVDTYGAQAEARVIQILLQICGSLYEAHAQGLVHRDIKPANIMLNRRGGQPDVVKVLDFGLVKQVDSTGNQEIGLAGTPLYMSPEAIQSPSLVDACSDLYAVGAVGYFLVTGKPVFEATTVVELLQKHVTETPVPPSQRVNIQVSHELEDALLSCLEKSRARRPQTARDLAQMLMRCPTANQWSVVDADAWWAMHDRRTRGATVSATGGSSFIQPNVTMRQTNVTNTNNSTSVNEPTSLNNASNQTTSESTSQASTAPGDKNAKRPTSSSSIDMTIWHTE